MKTIVVDRKENCKTDKNDYVFKCGFFFIYTRQNISKAFYFLTQNRILKKNIEIY